MIKLFLDNILLYLSNVSTICQEDSELPTKTQEQYCFTEFSSYK